MSRSIRCAPGLSRRLRIGRIPACALTWPAAATALLTSVRCCDAPRTSPISSTRMRTIPLQRASSQRTHRPPIGIGTIRRRHRARVGTQGAARQTREKAEEQNNGRQGVRAILSGSIRASRANGPVRSSASALFFAASDRGRWTRKAIQEGADPSGRPIVSAPRSAAIACIAAGVDKVAKPTVASLEQRRDPHEEARLVARGRLALVEPSRASGATRDAQERARLLWEEMAAQIANNTNRSLSLLTGVTRLLLPPTFITGVVWHERQGGCPSPTTSSGSSTRWRCAPYRRSRCMSQCAAWASCGDATRRWHGNYADTLLSPSKTTLPPQSLWI